MKCNRCQFENPKGSKFCLECGQKFEFKCPNCNKDLPIEAKFCNECGHNLRKPSETPPKDLSFDEKLTKIQKYLPKGLTEKILSQRDRIEGERKQVTVMFADMEGFTKLSERLGPEEAYTVIDQVYEILIRKVHDYEGTVNEFTGDGIMALFGAPIALEDAPQRAIRSAYSIQREMTRFSNKIKQEKPNILPIKMRIGIHTGPVVVGTLGNDLRVEFKAVGDTVNLASRMEGLAEPGTTYVTEETFRLTEGLFRFEALGMKEVKGKTEPFKVYRVIGPSTRRTRFDVSAERGLTPFVARERELDLILDGFERTKTGNGKVFSIQAEAGVGKSRLLYEFRKAVTNEYITFLEGKCLSYSKGMPYHPIIDILKSNFDILEKDKDIEIRDKVKRGLKLIGADEASTLPYLLEVLSVKDSGIDRISMSPEARKYRIIEALKIIVQKGSEIRPLIMAIEDLHWIDKISEDVLKNLLEIIPGAKLLLIFTYRPEFVGTWITGSYHSQLTLNRLSERESRTMVSHLLGNEDFDKNLEEIVLGKTEGVPFFIEEFINSLNNLRIMERKGNQYRLAKDIHELTIPSNIQDVIMARVDSLPENAKEVIQIGSVIEREFKYELIKRVTDLPEKELLSLLSVSKDSELLYERGIFPETSYIFKHALTRDVVYSSILGDRKKNLHEKIGNAIEELYRDNIDENCVVLVKHFIEGKKYEKAAEYAKLAAENAEKAGAMVDAIAFAKKRVASLERLSRTDNWQKEMIVARTTLGRYMLLVHYYAAAKKAVDPILEAAFKSPNKEMLPQILTIVGNYEYFINEDVSKAFKHLEKAIKICEELRDSVSLTIACWRLGIARSLNAEFEKATHLYEKLLTTSLDANNLWGVSLAKSYLSFFTHFFEGNISLAHVTSDEAIQAAEESGDVYSQAMAYTVHGISCYGKGFLEEAIKHLLRGNDLCARINLSIFNAIGRWMLGEAYYEIGDYQNSKDHYSEAVRLIKLSGGFRSWMTLNKIGEAMAIVMLNMKDIDLESLYGYVYENKLKFTESWKLRYIGEILLNYDHHRLSESEEWIKKAIKTHKRDGMKWYLAKDYALYAELFTRQGDLSKSKDNLRKAINILKECGADGWVEKYEKELAEL